MNDRLAERWLGGLVFSRYGPWAIPLHGVQAEAQAAMRGLWADRRSASLMPKKVHSTSLCII